MRWCHHNSAKTTATMKTKKHQYHHHEWQHLFYKPRYVFLKPHTASANTTSETSRIFVEDIKPSFSQIRICCCSIYETLCRTPSSLLLVAFVNEFLTIACSDLMFQDRTTNDDSDGKYRVFRTLVDSIFHENRHQTICSIFADIILALYLGAVGFLWENKYVSFNILHFQPDHWWYEKDWSVLDNYKLGRGKIARQTSVKCKIHVHCSDKIWLCGGKAEAVLLS